MPDAVLVAVISGTISLVGSVCTLVAQNRLTQYRLDQLEAKVMKHNNLIERTVVLERDSKTAFNRIDELRADIKDVREGK